MGKKTPLYDCHLAANAKMVDFAGWDMPLSYGSQVKEHHAVRQDAGMFDVSHMTIVDCHGADSAAFLRKLLANNVDRLYPGKALYSCMLNDRGGVVDDMIVYCIDPQFYRLIVNSATRDKDLHWMQQQLHGVEAVLRLRDDLAILAVQGPSARKKMQAVLGDVVPHLVELKPFHVLHQHDYFIACTGYTGEDGFEILLPVDKIAGFWNQCQAAGILPCGLGARDTLRLEAGLNLYGADMDESVTPLESHLAWTVAWEPAERDFVGRSALEQQKKIGVKRELVGLVLLSPGVLRNHQKVMVEGREVGEITSGSFSPTLHQGIALARVETGLGSACSVLIRGKHVAAKIVTLPFVHHGKKASMTTVE